MASSKTLNAANLTALGAAQLAELLLEISTGNAAAKRRLRLALAGNAGADDAAHEVAKRLASIAKAKGFIDWQKVKPLVADLTTQRRAILDLVAPLNPREAFELLWRLVSCAEPVFARSDDGSGRLAAVFREAAQDLGPLAKAASLDPMRLAGRAFEALCDDGYGAWDNLVAILAPQLGAVGLGQLKALTAAWQAEPMVTPPKSERRVIGWSNAGPIHADEIETGHRRRTAQSILQQIADVLGDVDAYIAQIDQGSRQAPAVAANIARRLVDAGRPQEAWAAIEAADHDARHRIAVEWEQARIDTLEALGRAEDAQAYRWERFLETLNASHLRSYLRKLAAFDDIDAEQRALTHALSYRDVHQALAFLVAWPDVEGASRLVLARSDELNGDLYEILSPAADALDAKHPIAATLVRRAMIEFTLGAARASRYKHAARHLAECASLARRTNNLEGAADHATYVQALRDTHGRKVAFWQACDAI